MVAFFHAATISVLATTSTAIESRSVSYVARIVLIMPIPHAVSNPTGPLKLSWKMNVMQWITIKHVDISDIVQFAYRT